MAPRAGNSTAPLRDWWWIFDPRHSLRARASLTFGAGAVLFTVLIGWITGSVFRRHLESHLNASFETLAFQVSDKIDRAIYERYRELQLTSSLPPFRDATAPADRRRLLEMLQDACPDFAWLGFADASGQIVAATRGIDEGSLAADRAWYRGARVHPYAGSLHELPELARGIPGPREGPPRFLDLAVPAMAASGQFLGVLGAHVSWTWAREVQTSVVPDSARRDRIGVTIYSATNDILLDSGGSGWTQPPEAPALPDPRRFRGSFTENTSGGTTYVTGYVRSRGFNEYRGLGWLVTVRQPVENAFAPVASLQRAIARWGLAFTGVLMAGSWLFAGFLARRIRAVGAAAARIRDGDVLTVLPQPHGESEMARMCGELGDMVGDFREKQGKLAAENARLRTEVHRTSTGPTPPREN